MSPLGTLLRRSAFRGTAPAASRQAGYLPRACLMKAQARAFRTGGSISTKGAASTTNHLVDASELQFGQPLHETHPHLLESGELTPGITAQEYHDRRVKLCEHLPKGSVAILEASTVKWATSSVFYPHVQDLNFLYLTGFQEDNAVAVIEKVSDDPEGFNFYLFVQAKNPAQEQWAGARSGVVAARDVFNADIAHDVAELSSRLPGILKTATSVYSDVKKPKAGHESTRLYDLLREGAGTEASLHLPSKVLPLSPVMDDLRMVKSPAEIANMRKAGKIAGRAITNLMRREWLFEQDIAAALEYDVKSSGCTGLSFIPVVAGGRNTSCVHYVHNNAAITPESLILVDAGGEYGRYVSDITRVWPQHGKFTTAQRDLYEALLTVQRRCVSLSRENAELSLNDLHREARTGLMAELERLGFPSNGYRYIDKLFNHHVGHYVGMDVHDCMGVSRNTPLKRGHCITIEPGVYVPNDSMFPKHFHGMGMRIEDSVAIDAESVINLTVEAVKEVADIENLRE